MGFARRKARGGFTLIELLTVTAVIVILATLIMTAVFSAQESGRNAQCRSNLLQLHKLLMIYTTTYDSYLPAFWHERWVGELGLAGGRWRVDITTQMHRKAKNGTPFVENMWKTWREFLAIGGRTAPPPNVNPDATPEQKTKWNSIRTMMANVRSGTNVQYGRMENPDDINPLMPMVWNNWQGGAGPGEYLGGGEYPVNRSTAGFAMCPSDISFYRSDQGAIVSYMGLAKYGWWHRVTVDTTQRMFEYHQIQEVDKPSQRMLLAESEPGTWQYGGCG